MNTINKILDELNKSHATLVVASKYINSDQILKLYKEFGINNFGENRVDAFLFKNEALKNEKDIKWHFIGHLQTNKVNSDLINRIDYLHSLDSLKLAKLINKYRVKPLKTFIEIKLTNSETKSGIGIDELESFLNEVRTNYPSVQIIGLMTMTEPEQSDEEKSEVFRKAYELGQKYDLKEISMGMSNDYKLALENHSTFVRLGRIICDEVKEYDE